MANDASAAIEFTEVPPVTVPTVNVVLGIVASAILLCRHSPPHSVDRGGQAEGSKVSTGAEKMNSKRRLPVPPAVIRLRRTPSTG